MLLHRTAFMLSLCFSCCLSATALGARIDHYNPIFMPGRVQDGGPLLLAIRTLTHDGVPSLLTVDTNSLQTALVPAARFSARYPDAPRGGYISLAEFQSSPYWQTLQAATQTPVATQNHGLKHAMGSLPGYILSVDMCPSRRPMEKAMFEALAELRDAPTQVAICMTGMWLLTHEEDMRWLQAEAARGALQITWVNHTFSHVYFPELPVENNFLMRPEMHVEQELLETERLLLERDALPSVFVRFPGLVADTALIAKARHLGLIPLGADAWLAHDEMPTAGSIVLVHGNGNEPLGIEALMPYLSEPATWHGITEAAAGHGSCQ